MSPEKLVDIFDAATKVTSPLALGAFAIAAVVAILWAYFSFQARQQAYREHQEQQKVPQAAGYAPGAVLEYQVGYAGGGAPPPPPPAIPKLAWIVLIVVVTIPVGAWAFVATHSDLPYIVRVLAVDKVLGLVTSDLHVVSSVGGGQSTFDGGVQFEIPPSSLPGDKSVSFFAMTKTSHGDKTIVFDRTRSVSVRIDLVPTIRPVDSDGVRPPEPVPSPLPKPSSINASWIGTYRSDKAVASDVQSIYTVSIGKDRFLVREERTENGQATCNAEWTGTAKQTAPEILHFTVSRRNQTYYFCSYTTPENLFGTVTRASHHEITVNIPSYRRWQNIELK